MSESFNIGNKIIKDGIKKADFLAEFDSDPDLKEKAEWIFDQFNINDAGTSKDVLDETEQKSFLAYYKTLDSNNNGIEASEITDDSAFGSFDNAMKIMYVYNDLTSNGEDFSVETYNSTYNSPQLITFKTKIDGIEYTQTRKPPGVYAHLSDDWNMQREIGNKIKSGTTEDGLKDVASSTTAKQVLDCILASSDYKAASGSLTDEQKNNLLTLMIKANPSIFNPTNGTVYLGADWSRFDFPSVDYITAKNFDTTAVTTTGVTDSNYKFDEESISSYGANPITITADYTVPSSDIVDNGRNLSDSAITNIKNVFTILDILKKRNLYETDFHHDDKEVEFHGVMCTVTEISFTNDDHDISVKFYRKKEDNSLCALFIDHNGRKGTDIIVNFMFNRYAFEPEKGGGWNYANISESELNKINKSVDKILKNETNGRIPYGTSGNEAYDIISFWDDSGGRLSSDEILEYTKDLKGQTNPDIGKLFTDILKGIGLNDREVKFLLKSNGFLEEIKVANPSIFDKDGKVKENANWAKLDFPNKSAIKLLYLGELTGIVDGSILADVYDMLHDINDLKNPTIVITKTAERSVTINVNNGKYVFNVSWDDSKDKNINYIGYNNNHFNELDYFKGSSTYQNRYPTFNFDRMKELVLSFCGDKLEEYMN